MKEVNQIVEYYKGYKIRLYPTKEQEVLIWKHIGCCRFVWNWMLAKQLELRKQNGKHLGDFDMINLLKPLKNDSEHEWLYEVSNASLQTVCKDLHESYKMFFNKKANYPNFKSKRKSSKTFPLRSDTFYFKNSRVVCVQKIGKIKYKTDFTIPFGTKQKFKNPRISNKNGKWFLSFSMLCENQARELTKHSIGIDLGVKELAVVEFNGQCKVFHNINKSKKMKKLNEKLKYYQRKQSRQYRTNPKNKSDSKAKGKKWEKSKNIVKTENKIRKIYAKITNIRQNYIHQTTHELIEMLPYRIVMEDLKISNMMKNRHLSRVIGEMCWYEFIRQMKYKCEWNGIEFVQVDKFYPSSKTCSCCGNIKKDLKLSDRTYICDICGLTIDRDYNAAINLSKYLGTQST